MMNENKSVSTIPELISLAEHFVRSGFFTDAADASKALVKILAGRELGFGPIAAMMGIYIVKGKPSLSANLMAAKVKASLRYDYRVKAHTAELCEIEFYQRNGDKWDRLGTSTFSLEDARKAGTQNLEKFPRNMLFARAMSNGVKWFCPDVMAGVAAYTPEELGATVNEDGEVVDAPLPEVPIKEVKVESAKVAPQPVILPGRTEDPIVQEAIELASDIRAEGRKYAGAGQLEGDTKEVQRLAAAVNKVFELSTAEEAFGLRHAVYSVIQNQEVTTGKQLYHGLVLSMLNRWTTNELPFEPNELAREEVAVLVKAYSIVRGQAQLPL